MTYSKTKLAGHRGHGVQHVYDLEFRGSSLDIKFSRHFQEIISHLMFSVLLIISFRIGLSRGEVGNYNAPGAEGI